MKKISQLCVLLCAIAPMAALSVTPDQPAKTNSAGKAAPNLDALFGDSVVAKGKSVEIKRNDLDAIVVQTKAQYAARQMPAPADLEPQALKKLIIQQLILSKANDADRAKGKEAFKDRLAKAKASSGMTDEEFDKRVSMTFFGGETRAQWDKERTDEVTLPIILQRELKVDITDDDVKKFYDAPTNTAAFEEPEMVRVSHILLTTDDAQTHQPLPDDKKAAKHKQLEDILKRARAGEDFAKLADQYSEDPGVKENHGEYKFSRNDSFVEEFKTTAFALTNVGQVSDIITSQFGYHIIKLSEKIPAKKVEFDKVKDGIKDHLMQVAFSKVVPAYTAKLVKDADIQILDEKLKNTDLSLEPPKESAPPAAAPAATK